MSEKTILYVEDNEYNRKIVRQLLSRTSYRLIEAADGEGGVALAQEKLPNLILMDVQLPKMSGLDATRALRAEFRTGRSSARHSIRAPRQPRSTMPLPRAPATRRRSLRAVESFSLMPARTP